MGRQGDRQGELMVMWSEMPRSPGHVFYDRLQEVLLGAGFDGFVEEACRAFYADQRLSGISCVGGHDGWKGAQPCRDAKSLIFLMPSWTSCWLGPIPRRPSIRTDFLTA